MANAPISRFFSRLLEKVRVIRGTDCEAYKLLRSAIDGTVTY